MTHRLASFIAVFAIAGCHGTSSDSGSGANECPSGATCTSPPRTPAVGHRMDGTVDIDAATLWPNRNAEPPPLTPQEIGEACAILARCDTSDAERATLLEDCIGPFGGLFWEERVVPTRHSNERWTFQVRAVIAAKDDCASVSRITTEAPPGLVCEEAGCWWASATLPVPTVACNGDVATLSSAGSSWTRDCARAFAKCDTTSPTGCTDRLPVACATPANDRCDGTTRIGCDGSGKVSFHDCSRITGGTCGDVGSGKLGCVYPDAGECTSPAVGCNGTMVELCVLGTKVDLPASEAGVICPM